MQATKRPGYSRMIDIFLSESSLNQGKLNCVSNRLIRKAIITSKEDSTMNCQINCLRSDPTAFRIPTSFARFSERAVLRFIKLMHASNKTKTAIIPNSQTNCIPPPVFIPFLNSAYKCHLLIRMNKCNGLRIVLLDSFL